MHRVIDISPGRASAPFSAPRPSVRIEYLRGAGMVQACDADEFIWPRKTNSRIN